MIQNVGGQSFRGHAAPEAFKTLSRRWSRFDIATPCDGFGPMFLIAVESPAHWKYHEGAVLRGMLTHGYDWTIIRHSATQRIPRLPHFLQQALNATNSAAAEQSELEVLA